MQKTSNEEIKLFINNLMCPFNECMDDLVKFELESNNWYKNMKEKLTQMVERECFIKKEDGYAQSSDGHVKGVSGKTIQRKQRRNRKVPPVMGTIEEHIVSDLSESIATRTRGALKLAQESESSLLVCAQNENEPKNSRSSRRRGKLSENYDLTAKKRSAQERYVSELSETFTMVGMTSTCKRVKQEKSILVKSLDTENELFTKPHNHSELKEERIKNSVCLTKLDYEISKEEFQSFNPSIHQSSPKSLRKEKVSPVSLSTSGEKIVENNVMNLGLREVEIEFIAPGFESVSHSGDASGRKKLPVREIEKYGNENGMTLVPDEDKQEKTFPSSKTFIKDSDAETVISNVPLESTIIAATNENSAKQSVAVKSFEASTKVEGVSVLFSESFSARESNKENEFQWIEVDKVQMERDGKCEGEITNYTGRITRTKSKMARKTQEKEDKAVLKTLARKSLNKAKKISLNGERVKGQQLKTLNSTPEMQRTSRIVYSKVQSALQNQMLLSSYGKSNIPLSTINSAAKMASCTKNDRFKSHDILLSTGPGKYLYLQNHVRGKEGTVLTPARGGISAENVAKSVSKMTIEDNFTKELKLQKMKEKEEEAIIKRGLAIKKRQEELRRKNEMKLQLAANQRHKLELEKYQNTIEVEKKKEEKRKILLKEREIVLKEKALRKKIKTEKKLAETEEKRRLKEETRIAKLKEQEAEQQRVALEKQKELERHEKRALERVAQEKAREQYELKLKQEQLKMEKALAAKKATKSASNIIKLGDNERSNWNYKSRNENDYGLENENSEVDSESEEVGQSDRSYPAWAQRVMKGASQKTLFRTQNMIADYMPCYQKTPDIEKIFKMTPTKRIKRTSSAIWSTPSS